MTACPATYQVLQQSRVGKVSFPARAYDLATTEGFSCDEAASQFTEFQRAWTAKLPGGWKPASKPTGFVSPTGARFSVKRSAAVLTSPPGFGCPYLSVAHSGRVGGVLIATGRYRVQRSSTALSCGAAGREFFALLYGTSDPDGTWRTDAVSDATTRFTRGSLSFTARRVFAATEGAGTFPSRGEYRCGPFFTVGNDDPIGSRFTVKKGRYSITTFGSTDCPKAVQILPTLLGKRSGVLPAPWRLRRETGSFVRSASGSSGFRLAPYPGG